MLSHRPSHTALNEVSTILNDYQTALLTAQRLIKESRSTAEIDTLVKLDDEKIYNALATLGREIDATRKTLDAQITDELDAATKRTILRTIILSVMLGAITVALIVLIHFRLCRPLKNIVTSIKKYSDKTYNKSLPERHRRDEIGNIANILEVWRQSARGKATLHDELEKTIMTMHLMTDVATAANAAFDKKHDAYSDCIEQVCKTYNWQVAHVWEVDQREKTKLAATNCWHLEDPAAHEPFRTKSKQTILSVGEGLPGMVLETGDVIWIKCADYAEQYPRLKTALNCGLSGCLGIPIKVQDKVVAVMEFYSSTIDDH